MITATQLTSSAHCNTINVFLLESHWVIEWALPISQVILLKIIYIVSVVYTLSRFKAQAQKEDSCWLFV